MTLTRREFIKGMGAVGGTIGLLAGFDHRIPYVEQPKNEIPGVTSWYATSCRECPAGCAMVVRNMQSRAVKCEGNPLSPVNTGALCARGQAALHGLYDPDRIKGPLRRSASGDFEEISWNDALRGAGSALRGKKRIAFVSNLETTSLASFITAWLTAIASTNRLLMYSPVNYEPVKTANGGVVPSFNIAGTDYLISFAADFLETWVSPVEYARDFASIRCVKNKIRARFVYIGPRVSMTAANADIRLIVPPGAEPDIAQALLSGTSTDAIAKRYHLDPDQLRDAARGLAAAKKPLALPGFYTEAAQAAAYLNGSRGSSLINTGRPHAVTGLATRRDMSGLVAAMESGSIDTLIIHDANPAYSLWEDLHFERAIKQVRNIISLSSWMDETTALAHWVLPSNTPLESWGDYAPYPDVINIMQPATGILFDTHQTGDILFELARFAGVDPVTTFGVRSYYEYVRRHWGFPIAPGTSPDAVSPVWESIVQRGGRWPGAPVTPTGATPRTGYQSDTIGVPVPITSAPSTPTAGAPPAAAATAAPAAAPAPPHGELVLYAYPHIYFYDGRLANRRWLQEVPTPIIRGAWTSWADISPSTARRLNIKTDDIIEVDYRGARIKIPAHVYEGTADDTIAIAIGQGHTNYGRYATDKGVNVLPLLDIEHPPVKVTNTGDNKWFTRWKYSSTSPYGQDIIETAELGKPFKREKSIIMPLPEGYGKMDFYPGHDHTRHRWAMVVDLDRCIGCHACTVACMAENNIGETSADAYYRMREMFWLRIDRYIDWSRKSAPIIFEPMLCQHCDAAPCEPVCPVYASVHSTQEGLNQQIYNRCVGTRYCANNCPYRVRRFNWFDYEWPEPLNWQLNPNVTVRRRGVMEKCTFCIQRIRQAEMVAMREGRDLIDGEVTPACVETCPTRVFTFGDLLNPNARVTKLINTDPRAFQVLRELNTKPAVIYLKKIIERT